MYKIVVIAILLSVYCLIAGCNCDCMSDSACTPVDTDASGPVQTEVTVGFSSETLVR
ncbi:MAG: hypothetical protein ACYSOP_05100 [Planctomycetota bacterium]